MRVLHIIHNLEIGGAQVILKTLLASQVAESIEPLVAVWKRSGPLQTELNVPSNNVFICPSSGNPLAVYRWLRRLVDTYKPDVIHAHMPDSGLWSSILSWRTGIPSLISYYSNNILFHTIDSNTFYGKFRWQLIRWASGVTHANVACADTVQDRVAEQLDLALGDIDVVPNGIEIPDVEALRSKSVNTNAINVVSVGRLEHIKGQYQLVECAPQLRKIIPNIRIFIVGEGPRLQEWRDRACALNVEDCVTLTDRVPDPKTYYRNAHVYVSTSHYEGSSMSLLEAMSWKIPIVASQVHGNTDIIEEGENGLFYPLEDLERMVTAIVRTIQDHDSARSRAEKASKTVLAKFSGESMHRGYLSIYIRLCETPHADKHVN